MTTRISRRAAPRCSTSSSGGGTRSRWRARRPLWPRRLRHDVSARNDGAPAPQGANGHDDMHGLSSPSWQTPSEAFAHVVAMTAEDRPVQLNWSDVDFADPGSTSGQELEISDSLPE